MPALALTFDDGPDPRWTPRILDTLRAHDAKATFFPIAPRAAAYPQLVRRIVGEGHAIALHCDEHVRHSTRDAAWGGDRYRSRAWPARRARGHPEALAHTVGRPRSWTAPLAAQRSLLLTGWSADTHDWRGDAAHEMFAAIDHQIEDGSMVRPTTASAPEPSARDAPRPLFSSISSPAAPLRAGCGSSR